MNETLLRLLTYALPPVLGAAIGYITNYLAIRMLFRPLTEKRFLGVRVPFTPGIIPRQRYQLSHSIARMVSTKLLTEDAVRARLTDGGFVESLNTSVSRLTSDVLDRVPEETETAGAGQSSGIAEIAGSFVEGFLASDAFRSSARRIVLAGIHGALEMKVGRVAPKEQTIRALTGNVIRTVSEGAAGQAIRASVVKWVNNHVQNNTPLHEVLGPDTLDRLADLLPKSYDPILDSLVVFLRQPDTRKELAIHGRELLKQILKRLNLFQRFLVSATQYDRTLNENMPAIITDLIESLETAGRNPENKGNIVSVFRSRLAEWGETGVGSLGQSLSLDLPGMADHVVASGLELLSREDVRERVGTSIIGFVERRADDTLEKLLGESIGLDREVLQERVVDLVDRWLERPDAQSRIADHVMKFTTAHLIGRRTRPLRELIALTDEQKRRVDEVLTRSLGEQLAIRVPELVDGLDIYGMVVQKIDGLDVESVEQLLLMVIAKHLKWINLFGALLGAIIGGIQVVVSILT